MAGRLGRRAAGAAVRSAVLALLILHAPPGAAEPPVSDHDHSTRCAGTPELRDAGWALFMDNDALIPGNRDHDYTGGLALTLAGRRARDGWYSLDPVLGWIDGLAGLGGDSYRLHSLQISMLAFTPNDIEAREPVAGDRPYASIVYLANSRTALGPDAHTAYQTSFALGVLGLNVARASQSAIHALIDGTDPKGWEHQISEGGEPTARYTYARLKLRAIATRGGTAFELKDSWALSAGYITEANAALSLRWGLIHTPWWSFTPERAEYMTEPAPVLDQRFDAQAPRELYFWAGLKARARVYNAFLQGQFRDSDLTYAASDMRPLIGEAWAGVTRQFDSGYRVSWVLRFQTSELRTEPGDRSLLWGGLSVSRSF